MSGIGEGDARASQLAWRAGLPAESQFSIIIEVSGTSVVGFKLLYPPRSEALRHSTTRVCTKVLRHTDLLQGFRVPEPQGPTGTEPILYLHLPYHMLHTAHSGGRVGRVQ